jgi:hypothetical protein
MSYLFFHKWLFVLSLFMCILIVFIQQNFIHKKEKKFFFFSFRNGRSTSGPPKSPIETSTQKHRSTRLIWIVHFVVLLPFYFSGSIFLPVFLLHSITLTPFPTQFAHKNWKGIYTHMFLMSICTFSEYKRRALGIWDKILFIPCVFLPLYFLQVAAQTGHDSRLSAWPLGENHEPIWKVFW